MNMTSIKVKFRPSTVDGKEGGLYFQIIHNRVVRQLNTDYKVLAEEWDAESESVIVNGNRSNHLLGIQERLAWDVARLEKVVRSLETERRRFTADDVITVFHKLTKESSLFTFMHGVIAQLKQLGVCLVQFSEGIRVPLSASFYQPCYLHRKHNVSIYIVLQQRKRLHVNHNFFI